MEIHVSNNEVSSYIEVYRPLCVVIPEFGDMLDGLENGVDFDSKSVSLKVVDDGYIITYNEAFIIDCNSLCLKYVTRIMPYFERIRKFIDGVVYPMITPMISSIKDAAMSYFGDDVVGLKQIEVEFEEDFNDFADKWN